MNYSFSFFDLWPYIFISLIFIICYNYDFKNTSKIIYLTLLFFTILRFEVGWDYFSYVAEIKEGVEYFKNSRYEPLSNLIFIMSASLKFYPLAFIIFGWLTLLFVFKSINNFSVKPVISWLVYYSLPLFFFASLSTLRQSLATVIILYSYKFLREKKDIKFFFAIFIATLFHTSGIFGILLWPIVKFQFNRTTNVIFFIVSFLFPIFLNDLLIGFADQIVTNVSLFSKYNWYLEHESVGTTKLQYLYFAFGIFNLIFYNRLTKLNSENKNFLNIANIGIVIFNVLSFEPISATRISAFFLVFLIYIIPYYPVIFKKNRLVIQPIIFILLLSISFFYLWIYIDSYESGVITKISFVPYKFWFNNIGSI